MNGNQEQTKRAPVVEPEVLGPAAGGESPPGGSEWAPAPQGMARREKDWLLSTMKERGRRRFDGEMESLAMVADEVAAALHRSAGILTEKDSPVISRYCVLGAEGLGRLASTLRTWDLETVLSRTRNFACAHPGLFLCGAMAAGFTAMRALEASTGQGRTGLRQGEGSYSGGREQEGLPG